jgi:putative transposase
LWPLTIVKRSDAHFVVLPKRWIVERSLAWISRNRRLMRDFERSGDSPKCAIRSCVL